MDFFFPSPVAPSILFPEVVWFPPLSQRIPNLLRGRRKHVKGKKLIFCGNLCAVIAWLLIVCCDTPVYLQLNSWTRCMRPTDLDRNQLAEWNNSWKCCSNPSQNCTLILLQSLKSSILLELLGVFKTVGLVRLSKVTSVFLDFSQFWGLFVQMNFERTGKGLTMAASCFPYEHP